MANTTCRLFETARTEFGADQRVARINIEGVVTSSVSVRIMQGCEDDVGAARASALVADYSRSLMNLSARALLASAHVVMDSGSWLRLPTAVIISRDDSEMWRTYCLLQGRRGVLRQAFTDPGEATKWAAEMASIYESEARRRERGLSR